MKINRLKLFFLRKYLARISLLILDVDGVLTDRGLIYNHAGEVSKKFDVRDGLGIKLLQRENIEVALVSGGKSPSTSARAKDLGIKYCFCQVKNKKETIEDLIQKLNKNKSQVAFVGDDLNDIVVKKSVSIFFSTNDATKFIKSKSDFVLQNKGGNGAIRETAEILLWSKNELNKYLEKGWIEKND